MNKIYSKKELKAKAQEVFEQYPSEDKVFAREDGNIFFNENLAELDKGKMKIYPLEKSDIEKADKPVENSNVDAKIVATEIKPGETVNENLIGKEATTDAPVTPLEPAPVKADTHVEDINVTAEIVASEIQTGEATGETGNAIPANTDGSANILEGVNPEVDVPKVDQTLGKDGKSPERRKSNNKK